MLCEFAAQSSIQARKHAPRFIGMSKLSAEGNLKHGSDQSSGQAVPGNVCDQGPNMLFVYNDEVVKVAATEPIGT